MNEEEIIKDLKNFIALAQKEENFIYYSEYKFDNELAERVQGLLDLYNKEKALAENHRIAFNKQTENLKEIEELYNKEKEKNKTFKDKIISKIEEVKKRNYNMAFIISGEDLKQECIDVLKDLLEDNNA